MSKKTTKRALAMSFVSVFLCVCMLVGTTFAWFTDSVTSSNNVIKSGTLDVEMYWAKGNEAVPTTDAGWTNAATGAIFNSQLWEPGYVEARHIKIENKGTLALKYQLNIVPNGTVSDLTDVIDVYYSDPAAQVVDRTALTADKQLGTLTNVLDDMGTTAYGELKAGESHTVTIALKMQESATNEYQDKSIGSAFAVQLLATQLTYEKDSFDELYDQNAGYAVEVNSADALADALRGGGLVKLTGDIAVSESMTIPAGVTVNLDLNGKTLTGTMHKTDGAVISNKGNLTIKGGTVKSTAPNGGSALQNAGTANVVNATLNGASNADGSWPSYTVNNTGKLILTDTNITSVHGGVASYGDGAVVTMNNTNLNMSGIPGFTSHGLYTYNNGQIVVNGGNIANNATDQAATGASVINGAVTVNAGTFNGRIEKYYGTPVIKGGTFDANPTTYVATGYQVTNNGDGTYTVGAYKVSTSSELADAIANGKAVVLTGDIVDVPVNTKAPYGNYYGVALNGGVLDGNGNSLDFNEGELHNGSLDNYGIMVSAGTIKNVDITGVFRGIVIMKPTDDIYIDNVTIGGEDVCYAINTAEGDGTHSLIVTNSTIAGWNSYGDAIKDLSFTDCTFAQGEYYTNVYGRLVKPYVTTVFENCKFSSKYYIDLSALEDGCTITLKNCTVNGVKLTAENWKDLIVAEDACGNGQISIEGKDGTYMSTSNIFDYVVID